MIKQNKWSLLVTSILILLPMLFGVIFWDMLPEQMTTHWGADGIADGWSGRSTAVFVLPLVLLGGHWLCVLSTVIDPKNKGQNQKVFRLVLWIIPVISLLVNGSVYAASLGAKLDPYPVTMLLIGAVFVLVGNYLPKCKQNHTIGIKVKWTLHNEANWNATHRFGGKLWVIGGLLLCACAWLPVEAGLWILFPAIIVLTILPILYSYLYHKKQGNAGDMTDSRSPAVKRITWVVPVLVLCGVGYLLFSGNIHVVYGDESLTIEASYWQDLTVEYSAIDAVEYRDTDDRGFRTYGFGGPRLLAGSFRSDTFGNYTRYSYASCDSCVVLSVQGKVLVINGLDADATKAMYEEIKAKLD